MWYLSRVEFDGEVIFFLLSRPRLIEIRQPTRVAVVAKSQCWCPGVVPPQYLNEPQARQL